MAATMMLHDQLAVAVVGAAATQYVGTNKANPAMPITMFFLNTTVVGTSITLLIEESVDNGATWQTRYQSIAITSAGKYRRVFFSPFATANAAESATVAQDIYLPPLMANDVRVTVTTVGVTTNYSLDQFSNRAG